MEIEIEIEKEKYEDEPDEYKCVYEDVDDETNIINNNKILEYNKCKNINNSLRKTLGLDENTHSVMNEEKNKWLPPSQYGLKNSSPIIQQYFIDINKPLQTINYIEIITPFNISNADFHSIKNN